MKYGFVSAAAITPELKVADVEYNSEKICSYMDAASQKGIKISVFPELCITGYTCQDLFYQDALLRSTEDALMQIAEHSKNLDGIFFVGMPLSINSKLYNVAAAISDGKVLGFVPKTYLPNYGEFYELRHFRSGKNLNTKVKIRGNEIPVCDKMMFCCAQMPSLRISAEICEDLWVPNPPSISHCLSGATMIVNLSASDEITGKNNYRRDLVSGQSARLVCGYVFASAGNCESTQDVVYSGHNILAENGIILAESRLFTIGITESTFDMQRIETERRRMTSFESDNDNQYIKVSFSLQNEQTKLQRYFDPRPFVPEKLSEREKRCEEIISIQAMGLRKRMEHIGCKSALIGISGGLDSTLALLVTVRAFDMLKLDHSGILAVSMPGFGTTKRTRGNAWRLVNCLGAEFREINIVNAVNVHFADIEHDPEILDITYENSQARERTQILMDMANKKGGIVIGTGDLSELALGWATYNGDHMSMYAVNSSVPKTLVRHLVSYFAETSNEEELTHTLKDILSTPVSPELLPPKEGEISQKTEDLVGPYELHDFFLYHMFRAGSSPDKILYIAKEAFKGTYSDEDILKWEKVFYRRFFAQHFKRSCLPDGPKVGSVAFSPRGDLRMPTDACVNIWMKTLEHM